MCFYCLYKLFRRFVAFKGQPRLLDAKNEKISEFSKSVPCEMVQMVVQGWYKYWYCYMKEADLYQLQNKS